MPRQSLNAWRYADKPTALFDRGKAIIRFLLLDDSEEETTRFQEVYPSYFPPELWKLVLRCGAQSHPAIVVGQIDTTIYEQRQTSGLLCHCYLAQSLLRIPDTGSCDIIRYLSCPDQITPGQQKKGATRRSIPLDIESAREMSMGSMDPRGRPFWQCYRDLLWAAWAHHFPSEWIPCLLSQVGAIPVRNDEDLITWKLLPSKSGVYSFQRDIMALVSAPWRARTCASTECGKPFVPNKNLRRYCSKECSIEAGHAISRKWWNTTDP